MSRPRSSGWRHRQYDLAGGGRLATRERGEGAPVRLLLHGFTGSGAAWGAAPEALALPGRTVLVDLPGHGGSDRSDDPRRYRIERVVDDLCELLTRLEARRADWAGYSMGGRIALAAAVLRPERVTRLVLESASPGLEAVGAREARAASDRELAERLRRTGIEAFVDAWMSQPLFASQRGLPAERLERARRLRLGNDPRALAAVLEGLGTGAQPSFWDRLDGIRCSTLLVAGARDAKFVALAGRMRDRIPDARVARIEGAGHAVHFEAPLTWARRVGRFLVGPPDARAEI